MIAEQFAHVADDVAKHVRDTYENGVLIAGGARLVAAALRAAVTGGAILDDLAAAMNEPEQAETGTDETEAAA